MNADFKIRIFIRVICGAESLWRRESVDVTEVRLYKFLPDGR